MSKSVSELAADKLKIGIVNLTDQSVTAGASYAFLSHYYPGYLEECHVLSPTESFSLRVILDESDFFNETYAQYKKITQITKCIAAFEERDEDGNALGKYVVQIKGLSLIEPSFRLTTISTPCFIPTFSLNAGNLISFHFLYLAKRRSKVTEAPVLFFTIRTMDSSNTNPWTCTTYLPRGFPSSSRSSKAAIHLVI